MTKQRKEAQGQWYCTSWRVAGSLITGTGTEKPSRHKTVSFYSIKDLSSPCEIHIFPCTARSPISINKHECQRTGQTRILPWFLVSGMTQDFASLGINFIGQELWFSFVAVVYQVQSSFLQEKCRVQLKAKLSELLCPLCFPIPFLSA